MRAIISPIPPSYLTQTTTLMNLPTKKMTRKQRLLKQKSHVANPMRAQFACTSSLSLWASRFLDFSSTISKRMVGCQLSIVLRIFLFTLLLDPVGNQLVIGMGSTREPGPEDDLGCSANSFLIGDGECNDVTNVPRCLYDGGDCCLENKKTSLCTNCTCILDVDRKSLNRKLKTLGARLYTVKKSDNFLPVKTVKGVASEAVCQILCLDIVTSGQAVDSWMFYPGTKGGDHTCVCTLLNTCYYSCVTRPLTDVDNPKLLGQSYRKYILTNKTVSCGK